MISSSMSLCDLSSLPVTSLTRGTSLTLSSISLKRIPSELIYCSDGEEEGIYHDTRTDQSTIWPSISAPTRSESLMSTIGTGQIGTAKYKMMGLATPDAALTELDTATAVLFHGKMDSEERPLLLAVIYNKMRFLLRISVQHVPEQSNDRFWGICGDKKKIFVAFRSKETLLQFYAMCPQAAIMSYFDV